MSNDKDFKVKNGVKPTVYHEKLGTVVSGPGGAYDLAVVSYDGVSFSVAAQETFPYGLFFKPDGTKMYVVGQTGDDINEYNLSTAWNISTASYVQNFSVAAQDTAPLGLFFKPDGTKMYVAGFAGADINEYNLSTAWNISTASYVQNFSVVAQETQPNDVFFKPDGTKMYVVGFVGDDINEYNLSTAWNISTATYVQNFSVASQDTQPVGIFFKPDGTKMYVVGGDSNDVNEYNLSTAWNISTASYVQNFTFSAQGVTTTSVQFKSDGTKMYALDVTNDAIYQYSIIATKTLDLSTGSVFQLTPASNIQLNLSNPAASGTVSGATLLLSASGTAYTITYDSSIDFPGGTAPTSPAIGDTDVLVFTTRDGGTSYKAALAIDGAA